MRQKVYVPLLAIFICILVFPVAAEARHGRAIDRSDLDDDVVESFPIPVLFGVNYNTLVPDFGDPRGGGTRQHEGQDMVVPLGTPIVSPTEAIVIRTGTGESAGKYVYTANPGGETFVYMHLDYIADLDPGDKLDPGDFIGTVGDTGNAPDGVYHLHFEVRDEDNDATDPYERMTDAFTLKEKVSFLPDIFRDIDDGDEYAEFLIETYENEFIAALDAGYRFPDEVDDVLDDTGATTKVELMEQFNKLIDSIPGVLTTTLSGGDQGVRVALLQTYILMRSEGPARDRLAASGATGYYGSITSAAVAELQEAYDLDATGVWGSELRKEVD